MPATPRKVVDQLASSTSGGGREMLDVVIRATDGSAASLGGSGGTSEVDDAAFTAASDLGTPIMGFVTADAVDAGDVGVVGMTTARNLRVSIQEDAVGIGGGIQYTEGDTDATIVGTAILWEDAADTLRPASAAAPLPVAVISGGGGGTQYTEDAAAAANPVGTALNLIRDDARAGTLTTADGDNVAARGTNAGELYVKHVDTIAVTQSGTWDEVGINDSGNSITVDNPQLSVVGGGTEATALRVTVASDSTGVLSIDDNGGSLTVDNAQLSVIGTGTEAAALRVTIASDSTGVLSVDDNGGSLTVDGTVTANLAAGTNNIGDVDILSIAAGDNNIGNVDVVTLPALPAGTNNIGDIDVLSIIPGTGATNLGKAEDAAHTSGDVGVLNLGVRVDTPNVALSSTDADYSPLVTNKLGSLRVAVQEDDLATAATKHVKKYYTNAGAVTDGIIWSPAAGTRWFITDIFINVSAAATVTLEDDLAGGDSPIWKAELAANSGWSHSFNTPWFSGEDAADLIITTTAGNVYVTVVGYEI